MGFVQTDLRAALSQKMDSALWRSTGGTNEPTGIMKIAGVASFRTRIRIRRPTPRSTLSFASLSSASRVLHPRVFVGVGHAEARCRLPAGSPHHDRPGLCGYAASTGQKVFKGYRSSRRRTSRFTLNVRSSNDDTEIALVAGPRHLR